MNAQAVSLIVECLQELAGKQYQMEVWLGKTAGRMSSFTEAIEGLFDDSGLGSSLDNARRGGVVFSLEVDSQLRLLGQETAEVRKHVAQLRPDDMVNHPSMEVVRRRASTVLEMLRTHLEQ